MKNLVSKGLAPPQLKSGQRDSYSINALQSMCKFQVMFALLTTLLWEYPDFSKSTVKEGRRPTWNLHWIICGSVYCWNHLGKFVLMAVPIPLLNEFATHHRLESCVRYLKLRIKMMKDEFNWKSWAWKTTHEWALRIPEPEDGHWIGRCEKGIWLGQNHE